MPALDQWVDTGPLQDLVVSSIAGTNVSEVGPALLVPGGRMLAIGGNGRTALYTAGANPADPGTWANGQNFPADTGPLAPVGLMTVIDDPATLLPNGSVLCVAGRTYKDTFGGVSYWSQPSTFCLYDIAANSLKQLADELQPTTNTADTWTGCLLLLPSGSVLYTTENNKMAIYKPDASELTPQDAWRPTISSFPTTVVQKGTYSISGTQFNGMSQANGYGDDRQNATNYPLVRVTDTNGNVRFLPTSSFSTMSVQTGCAPVTVNFQVPSDLAPGTYSLVVIANGIASAAVSVVVIGGP